jgi:lipoate-protein ligase A
MTAWRILEVENGAPGALLERGLALLDGLASDATPTLRWYRSTSPALVVGRGQAVPHDAALPVAIRYSGGGAVLLDDGLLNLDVLLPAGHPLLGGDLGAVFERIGHAWADALRDLGLADVTVHRGAGTARRRGSDRERLLAAICYATIGRGEVLVGGRKLVGLAQRRRRPGALVQCGLLRWWRPAPLLAALGADPDDRDVSARAVGLDELLDPPPSDAAVMAAVNACVVRPDR